EEPTYNEYIHMTQLKFKLLGASLVLSLATHAGAENHDEILAYLADDVVAVAYVDAAKVDAPASVQQLIDLDAASAGDVQPAMQAATVVHQTIEEFRVLGIERIYLILRTADIAGGGPTWVLTVDQQGDPQAIVDALRPLLPNLDQGDLRLPRHFYVAPGVILAAPTEARLSQIKESGDKDRNVRPQVADAVKRLGSHNAGVMIFGDADSRRVVREMFPRLPAPFDAIDGRLIADGLQWGGASIDLPPNLRVATAVQANDSKTAESVRGVATIAIDMGKAMAAGGGGDLDPMSPVLVKALDLIRLQVDDALVTLTLGDAPEEVAALTKMLGRPIREARDAAERRQRINSFKMLALAMHNYEARNKTFAPAAIVDDQGRPLLSWRVAILPYVDQEDLYDQFRLDEPWDSAHNQQLIAQMPEVYADPNRSARRTAGEGRTTFVVPTGPDTVFAGHKGMMLKEITDGMSSTVMIVEVVPDRAVTWSQPADWEVDFADPFDGVADDVGRPFITAFCDGSARNINPGHPLDQENWPRYLRPTDGEITLR
ncbi:DUF1559 domain-containing protein, partial [Pirellulales bacterium]|nr:DUF1559 domain-containing protein [Pirellulales bacterium]